MSNSEAKRQGLYNRVDEVLGKPYSDTLMSSLPASAAELATKGDIAATQADIAALEKKMERRLDKIESHLAGLPKTIIWSMVGLTGIYSGILVAVTG